MAKKKPSAVEALARVRNERAALERRAADLKRAAALEVGMVVLDAGGADLDPHHLRSLISHACALGGEVARDFRPHVEDADRVAGASQ